MTIPRIIHQTWKTEDIPPKWRTAVDSVKRYHPGWEYRLWTHAMMDDYVREHHPDFFPVFAGMEKDIMRADSFRLVLMNDIGGMYCDLDYEFLRPYDYGDAAVVLSAEWSTAFGDNRDSIASFFFASEPGHPLWADAIADLRDNPPVLENFYDVVKKTGPAFLTRIYDANKHRYEGIRVEPRLVFHPKRTHSRHERANLLNNGITHGIHLGSGSWKERWTLAYFKKKISERMADIAFALGLRVRRR